MPEETTNILQLVGGITAAYLEKNHISTGELPDLIQSVHAALAALDQPAAPEAPASPKPTPASTVRKSLASPDKIISMIDGKPYTTLKRHITGHGYTPASYREAFGLKSDYPMVAPSYSAKRADISKAAGFGRKKASTLAPQPAPEAPKLKRSRKPKSVSDALASLGEDLPS